MRSFQPAPDFRVPGRDTYQAGDQHRNDISEIVSLEVIRMNAAIDERKKIDSCIFGWQMARRL